ncbi:MAG: hypothetical protein ACYS91_14230 [Planctomycetota bacterium]
MLLRIPEARISHSRHAKTRTGRNRKACPAKLRPHLHPPGRLNCRVDIFRLGLSTEKAGFRAENGLQKGR